MSALHERLHRGIVAANLGHNPGCDDPDCPQREPDPTLRRRIVATIRTIAEHLGVTEGTDRG